MRTPHCGGVSCCKARALGWAGVSSCRTWVWQLQLPGSRVQAQCLWHTGLAAPRHGGSSWAGIETASSAPPGGLLTPESPGQLAPDLGHFWAHLLPLSTVLYAFSQTCQALFEGFCTGCFLAEMLFPETLIQLTLILFEPLFKRHLLMESYSQHPT